ncbi:MAG: hypothetical protein AAB386_02705 [Patescibacteria group bacterium]
MTDKTKKILFAIGFGIVSIAIGFGLYYLIFRPLFAPTPTVVEGPPEEGTLGALPSAGTGAERVPAEVVQPGELAPGAAVPVTGVPAEAQPTGVVLLRDTVTQAVSPGADGKGARFYDPNDGRFYRVNADGSITPLGDKAFLSVQNVEWAGRTDSAILEFPDGSNVYYDFNSKRQVTLPKHWEDFSFSPDDTQVVAKSVGLDPSNRFLIVSDPSGNEAKAVEELGRNGHLVTPMWSPNNQVIAFSQTGRAQPEGAQEIYLIGENGENFKSLIVPGRGFQPNWSPTGQNILYSVYHERDNLKPSLWISGGAGDNIGENRRSLNLNTWADKCAWRNDSELICGVPQSLDTGAGLAPQRSAGVPDDVYSVNLKTGVSTKINTPEQIHPIRQPVLSKDKKQLIFTDAATGQLLRYDLP